MKNFTTLILIFAFCAVSAFAQKKADDDTDKSEAIIAKAIAKLGGDLYKNVKSLSSSGKLSILKEQKIASFQSFVDVILYPDKERTDFSERGTKTIQVNKGETGWIYDELFDKFGPQTEKQIENFKQGLQTHYDFLLRRRWKGKAELTHAGRRRASLGKRNDVLRLEFENDFWIEYEFSDEGLPMKTVYPIQTKEGAIINEESRYAQYIFTDGILFPYIIDHFVYGKRTYRVNYVNVRLNKRVNESIFTKPANPKKIKKLKL